MGKTVPFMVSISFFQPEINIEPLLSGNSPFFVSNMARNIYTDRDRKVSDLLYRHSPEYAVGHGCAVIWTYGDNGTVKKILTQIIPGYELPQFTPDFDELCAFIGMKLRRRALLIFLTNLDDPVLSESFVRNMDLLSRKHLVIVAMIKPQGTQPIFTDPDVKSLDDIYQHLGSHMIWHNFREIERTLKRKGVHFSLASNEAMCSHLVSQYMNVKQRQLI